MKLKGDYILKEIVGDYIVVPVGTDRVDLGAVITLNETGAFLWKKLIDESTESDLVDALCSEFEVERAEAEADVREFIGQMRGIEAIEG